MQYIRFLYELEFWGLIHKQAKHIEIIVHPFGTVYDRTTFYGNTSAIGFYFIVGFHGARLHINMYFHLISLFPFAVDAEVSVLQITFYFFSVDSNRITESLSVTVGIKVARHYLILYPSRDT